MRTLLIWWAALLSSQGGVPLGVPVTQGDVTYVVTQGSWASLAPALQDLRPWDTVQVHIAAAGAAGPAYRVGIVVCQAVGVKACATGGEFEQEVKRGTRGTGAVFRVPAGSVVVRVSVLED